MSAIKDLIDQIENVELRMRVQQEVERMNKQKKFGLVFEEHLPENTPLYELSIRRGLRVAKRDGDIRDTYQVISVKDGIVECEHLNERHDRALFPVDDLIAVAQLGEPIYPYLKPMGKVMNAPDSDLWHTLIEADNYHALQLLVYLYGGKVDCIYIDPPYNSGARDWKYNNDYVDGNDSYRHSKWLSMMEKRLKLARKLLNPSDSTLIVTIDEKEYLHIGCLLEQMFPEAAMQMITSVINRHGSKRKNLFTRCEEYIYYVFLGNSNVKSNGCQMLKDPEYGQKKVVWKSLCRTAGNEGLRSDRPNMFYPIYFNSNDGTFLRVGESLPVGKSRLEVGCEDGETIVWPLARNGQELRWGLQQETFIDRLKRGFVRFGKWNGKKCSINYLTQGLIDRCEKGDLTIVGYNENGVAEVVDNSNKNTSPFTVWNQNLHDAGNYGTNLISNILKSRSFDFPKSVYAEKDTIKLAIGDNPNALILDFFAGSGTTLHAVNLLNAEDGGQRRCIMVTNNEIGETKENELKSQGIRPGDEEWERWGIARYVTWPRTECSIKGVDVNGNPIDGEYVTTKTETKLVDRKFNQINFLTDAPTFKQKKALVTLINKLKTVKLPTMTVDAEFLLAEDDDTCNASILFNVSALDDWKDALEGHDEITDLYVVTEKDVLFRKIKADVNELMGQIEESIPITIPMKDGFKANATYFKLGFLDKTSVALGRQFKELLPILWMKAGARGECPTIDTEELPQMLICEKNHFAVLIDENVYLQFEKKMRTEKGIDVVYIITDSEGGYKEMAQGLQIETTYQLYRDYLDNFRINNIG